MDFLAFGATFENFENVSKIKQTPEDKMTSIWPSGTTPT
jgi:hypothetical protein